MSDIHQETARQLRVNKKVAKTINFGVLYGSTNPINFRQSRRVGKTLAIQTELIKLHKKLLEEYRNDSTSTNNTNSI